MANPNTNTARKLTPEEMAQAADEAEPVSGETGGMTEKDNVVEFSSVTDDEKQPDTLRTGVSPEEEIEVEPVTLRAGEKSPEEYAKMKGIPNIKFPDPNNAEILIDGGVLVDCRDDEHLRVVGYVGKALITTTLPATELYKVNESYLEG